MRAPIVLSLVAACALSGAGLAHAGPVNLVVNGSFEATPIAGQWQQVAAIDGWTSSASGTAAFELQKGASQGGMSGFAPVAADGVQYLELNTTTLTSVAQTVATSAQARYTLSFAYAGRPDTPGGDISAMNVYWNDIKLNASPLAGQNSGAWTLFSVSNLLVTGNATRLRFESVGPVNNSSYGSYLDNVSVTASVPEPVTISLFLLGLVGVGFTRRARRPSRL